MNTYIALFRGINVGGKNILPMKNLVAMLEEIGCKKVKTYIQSGNAIFQNKEKQRDKIGQNISSKIMASQGFAPKVLLLEKEQLLEAIANNPYDTANGKVLHFFFLSAQPKNADIARLNAIKSNSEEFKLYKNTFYFYAPAGIARSKLASQIEKILTVPATARNWNTVNKLMAMIEQA
jgi:uncharacterized protein (DUF1697 family)